MIQSEIEKVLLNKLGFLPSDLRKMHDFHDNLLKFNKKYNLIAKSTEKNIWDRHILDSAQLVSFIKFNNEASLSDLGTGAGFPGLILAIFNKNSRFHVKLYEKSKVKCDFLNLMKKKLNLSVEIYPDNFTNYKIDANYVVSRAFKKLEYIMHISREIIKVNHKLIILKGENAESEINNLSEKINYEYELFNSMTNKFSKILIVNIKKN
tara:strand:- start:170 stop:793 length:624 start_codon:yes stop_codon:yes gene_type:complete